MSTRGPQRWCPECRGQVYFHHAAKAGEVLHISSSSSITLPVDIDIWYCQSCGQELAEDEVLHSADQAAAARPKRK